MSQTELFKVCGFCGRGQERIVRDGISYAPASWLPCWRCGVKVCDLCAATNGNTCRPCRERSLRESAP